MEIYYWILRKKVKERLQCQYTTRKKFGTVFPILKCNIRYMNFLGS